MNRLERLEFFNRCASDWDKEVDEEEFSKLKKVIKIADIKRGERVLDVGCGTGIFLPLLKEAAGKKGEVVALDFSSNMLKKAKEKFGEQFRYIQAEAENMPLEDSSFDKVISFASFPHFSDKKKAISEIWRVLRPGGKLLIAHPASRKRINSIHREIGGAVRNDTIPNNEKITDLFKKAGFTNVKITNSPNFYSLFATK